MRGARQLIIISLAGISAGIACAALGLLGAGTLSWPVAWPLIGLFVSLIAAGSATAQCIRCGRRDRKLMSEIQEHVAAIHQPPPESLKDLERAVASLVASAECAAGAAALRAKELEIRLKVAQAERQHAEAIIYNISDAVLVTDPADELVLANESAARTFEFDLALAGHLPLDQVLRDPKMISLIREMRYGSSTGAGGRRIVEHRVHTVAGERTFKITLSTISDVDDAPGGVVAILHDITREKEISEMKNDFVSMVSHELRTPLASIKAYVEMLLDGEAQDPPTQREFHEVIQNEANRLGRLIDNILNISRIESGLVRVDRQMLDLGIIVKDAVDAIAPQARQKNVAIEEKLANLMDQTPGDRDMLYQAVLNLLSNAVKYTPAGGSITVEVSSDRPQNKVLTRIVDTGVGIPPRDLPFVFDKFYRAEANNRMAPGTGLGLSLVRYIIETIHHGRMLVESHVGKGSCFGFELETQQ